MDPEQNKKFLKVIEIFYFIDRSKGRMYSIILVQLQPKEVFLD
jgi:hypothetical protein